MSGEQKLILLERDPEMKARYHAVYKVHGASGLSKGIKDENFIEIFEPHLTATFTTEPEMYFRDIDRENAVRTQLVKGLFAPETLGAGSIEVRLELRLEKDKALDQN